MAKKTSVLILGLLIFLIGCQSIGPSSKTGAVPTPEAGKAVIHGKILSEDKSPRPETVVRLAKVFYAEDDQESGTFILDEANSPSTISEADGAYIFLNIDPGDYVLFVGQFHNDYMVVSDAAGDPNVYTVGAGQVLEIEPIITLFD